MASLQQDFERRLTFDEVEHELRTPLASLRSMSEILRDYPDLSAEERSRFIEHMVGDYDRLERAVDRLLAHRAVQQALT
ncbi:MAG: histidine kinase dimerization/phospho-acceptor domain-containing protein [Geminicoccaceae bacterium]